MAQESSFNPKARSKVGAQGLMQVMPKTGAWMAKKMGLKGKLNLYNPETSINIGCAYLKYLKGRKGGGSATGILRGYNGGPRRMYKPSKQTSAYASQVQRRRNTVK
ncbi:MAG: transglycosylase SLT domain-containing protein [Elusimicrobiales bacterium]